MHPFPSPGLVRGDTLLSVQCTAPLAKVSSLETLILLSSGKENVTQPAQFLRTYINKK